MMIARISPLALVLLAACSNPFAGTRATPDLPEQAACRQAAQESEEVRRVEQRWAPGQNDLMIQSERRAAEDRAFRNCLRERRLPGANGVELPRR